MRYEPLTWNRAARPTNVDDLRQSRLTALIRAADTSLKAPAVKRIAAVIGVAPDEFLRQWASPQDMPNDVAASVAWHLYDQPLATPNPGLRLLAASFLAAERDAEVLAERRWAEARDMAWRQALSVGLEYAMAITNPYAQVALAEIELLSVAAPSYPGCLVIEQQLARDGQRYRMSLDLVNHVRQSLAVLTDAGPFPDAAWAAQADESYEEWVEQEGDSTARDTLRTWWGVALTLEEWLNDVAAVWSAVDARAGSEAPGGEVSARSGVRALIWALDEALIPFEESGGEDVVETDQPAEPVPAQPAEEPFPDWASALVSVLVKRWNLGRKPDVREAFRRRAGELRQHQSALKYDVLAAAARVVWGARDTPWLPRWDSDSPPIIPSTLSEGDFRKWFARETIKAAESDLLGHPYPLPTDGYGRKRHGRDLWESGEADALEGAGSDHADDDAVGETPAWDRQDWEIDIADVPLDRSALPEDDLARLRALASPAVREAIDLYLDLALKGQASWAEVARRRGVTEGAVRTQIQRLRSRAERLGF